MALNGHLAFLPVSFFLIGLYVPGGLSTNARRSR